MKKIVVVGCGNVGMAYVNNLVNTKGLVDEIVMIDLDREKILAEAMDLSHAATVFNNNVNIKAGSYKDCFNADLVVITAGLNQEKGVKIKSGTPQNSPNIKIIYLLIFYF